METISSPKEVRAKKEHVCNWCGGKIQPGEMYNTATYKYDSIYTWKSHTKCIELVTALEMEGDEGVSSDDFYDYIWEAWRDSIDDDVYESKGFTEPDFKDKIEYVYQAKCAGN